MERVSLFFLLVFLSFFVSSFSASYPDEDDAVIAPVAPTAPVTSYIVIVNWPKGEQPRHFTIRILTSILGSEEAAREALICVYNYAFSGFAAYLTPQQVSALKRQSGVVQIFPSSKLELF